MTKDYKLLLFVTNNWVDLTKGASEFIINRDCHDDFYA